MEPVSVVPDQRLQLGVFEDAQGRLQEPLVQVLVVHRAEVLDDEADGQILVTMEHLCRVNGIQLQPPFCDMDGLVAQLRELEVPVLPPEIVDAFLREDGLHEAVAVADEDVWQDLDHDHRHVSSQGHGHLGMPATLQFLLVRQRELRQ